MILQELIFNLTKFWSDRGVLVHQPYDLEMGAGTMHPETFLRVLGPNPWKVVYVQPSRRPADGRYGENPNRLYKHHQLQLILKPAPADVQELYLESLRACGIDPRVHDIRFEEDNWESPTLGAWGIGWQVLLDGLEITQFTGFSKRAESSLRRSQPRSPTASSVSTCTFRTSTTSTTSVAKFIEAAQRQVRGRGTSQARTWSSRAASSRRCFGRERLLTEASSFPRTSRSSSAAPQHPGRGGCR
jgi:hypothetical protein